LRLAELAAVDDNGVGNGRAHRPVLVAVDVEIRVAVPTPRPDLAFGADEFDETYELVVVDVAPDHVPVRTPRHGLGEGPFVLVDKLTGLIDGEHPSGILFLRVNLFLRPRHSCGSALQIPLFTI